MDKIKPWSKWTPLMYVNYFPLIQKIVKDHGYILCVHGSVVRDFDLVAVPFDEEVKPHADVLASIKQAIGLEKSSDPLFDLVEYEPHGRICYTIECGGGGYFDISFMPSLQQTVEKLKRDTKRDDEVATILNRK